MMDFELDQLDCPGFLDELISSLPLAVFICAADGTILDANTAAKSMFGYAAQNLRGRDLSMFFTPEDIEILYSNLLHLALVNGSVEEQAMLLRRNEVRFMAMVHIKTFVREQTRLIVVHVQDIDHAKQMENVLREIGYKDLLRVANGVGHEIRNPLLIIGGYLRKMYTSCKTTDEDDAYYKCIVENLKKIENIVRKIDFFTNPPRPVFFKTSTELVAEQALQNYAEELRDAGVHRITEVQTGKLPMDRDLIARALSILVENALDVLHSGGEIRITGHSDGQWYVFSVQDNGPGIIPADLDSIFQPFFSTKPHSAGIDLAILKRIIESHHGRVEVVSEPGQGARFDLFLPLERRRLIRTTPMTPSSHPAQPAISV